jgi:hypothetical protein
VEDTIQCVLRHEKVSTTQPSCIKTAPQVAQESMRIVGENRFYSRYQCTDLQVIESMEPMSGVEPLTY